MTKPYYSLESLEPNNSVGFLIKRCGVLMSQIAERRFEELPISFMQWMALAALNGQGCVSASQLSAYLGHDMGALTRVVDELERQGLLRRERSVRDRRSVEIAISAAGRRQAESGKRVLVELLNELVAPCSEREIDTLIELLQRLMRHLQNSAEPPPAAAAPPRRAAARPRRRLSRGAA
jgi:DNA-binding MarR family transcriptional regulator